MRESPAIAIISALQDGGAHVRAYDPEGMDQARAVLENVEYSRDAYGAADKADALVLVTEWDEFRALDFERLRAVMRSSPISGGSSGNVYRVNLVTGSGFDYVSVGRPK